MLITYYRIFGGDEEYIGSTKKTLGQRWSEHKSEYRLKTATTTSHILFEKYGVENCRIEEIETRECATPEERKSREAELILALPNCVNKYIPGRTMAEWYEANTWINDHKLAYRQARREEINTHSRTFYEAHREEINARQRERRRAAQTN